MSDERKAQGETNPKPPGSPRKLLKDLESIRDLLDAEEGVDIPVLREIVPPPGPGKRATGSHEVQHDMFEPGDFADRLFDESWRQRSEAILTAARERADELAACIDPEVDDAVLEALHERVDAELPPALEQVVTRTLDDLQDRLLEVLETELTRLVAEAFGTTDGESSTND